MQVTRPTFLPLLAPADPQRMGDGAVWDEYCGDLTVIYTFGPPFGKRVVTHADLEQMQISAVNLRRGALEQLELLAGRAQCHGQTPAMMLSFDGLESSLLLASEFWNRLQGRLPGELVVGVPARDVVIVTGSQSQPGLEKARRAVDRVFFAGDEHLLTRQLLVRRGTAWEPFERSARPAGRPVAHGPDQRPPRQYQDHPSWPAERLAPVAAGRPTSADRAPIAQGPPLDRRPSPLRPMRPTQPLAPAAAMGPASPVVPVPPPPIAPSPLAHASPGSPASPTRPGPPPAPSATTLPPAGGATPLGGGTPTRQRRARPPRRPPATTSPYSAVPYSAVPYSAVPYSAVPYSAVPYSAVPASAVPASAIPNSAIPHSPMGWSRGAQAASKPAYNPSPTYPTYDDSGGGPRSGQAAIPSQSRGGPHYPDYAAPVSAIPRSSMNPHSAPRQVSPVYSAPPSYNQQYSAPPAYPPSYPSRSNPEPESHQPIYPESWGYSPSRPSWDGSTGARSRFSR